MADIIVSPDNQLAPQPSRPSRASANFLRRFSNLMIFNTAEHIRGTTGLTNGHYLHSLGRLLDRVGKGQDYFTSPESLGILTRIEERADQIDLTPVFVDRGLKLVMTSEMEKLAAKDFKELEAGPNGLRCFEATSKGYGFYRTDGREAEALEAKAIVQVDDKEQAIIEFERIAKDYLAGRKRELGNSRRSRYGMDIVSAAGLGLGVVDWLMLGLIGSELGIPAVIIGGTALAFRLAYGLGFIKEKNEITIGATVIQLPEAPKPFAMMCKILDQGSLSTRDVGQLLLSSFNREEQEQIIGLLDHQSSFHQRLLRPVKIGLLEPAKLDENIATFPTAEEQKAILAAEPAPGPGGFFTGGQW